MPTNNFLEFATGGSANVEDQATYAADSQRTDGNQSGVARSAFVNKALRQANFVTSNLAQVMANFTGSDVLDNAVTAQFLQTLTATLQRLPPVITKYTSGSGNHNLSYYFFCASANATAGATYTNNGVTYTVSATIASGTLLRATGNGAPSVSGTLTKSGGTGDTTITFYAVRSPIMLEVEMVGGGGGGSGSGRTSSVGIDGGNGGNTTFGTTLLVANGGSGGSYSVGGAGGSASLGTGPSGTAVAGGAGQSGNFTALSTTNNPAGGNGGVTPFGGAGGGGPNQSAGVAAATNSGSGGGGGGNGVSGANNSNSGGGGGAGGYVHAKITTILSTYAYAVGALGTAGAAGTDGFAGAAGAAGQILVTEHFQ